MITEDYVSLETAKLLKEKWFNEPCTLSHFDLDAYKKWFETAPRPITIDASSEKPFRYPVPSIYVAMKWLMEVHNLHIEVFITTNKPRFQWKIYRIDDDSLYFSGGSDLYYEKYEQACEAGIKYCLENLINHD